MEVVRIVGFDAFGGRPYSVSDILSVESSSGATTALSDVDSVLNDISLKPAHGTAAFLVTHRRAKLLSGPLFDEKVTVAQNESSVVSPPTLSLTKCTQPAYPGCCFTANAASGSGRPSRNTHEGSGSPKSRLLTLKNDQQSGNNVEGLSAWSEHSDEFFLWSQWLQTPKKKPKPNLLFFGLGSKQAFLSAFTATCLRY